MRRFRTWLGWGLLSALALAGGWVAGGGPALAQLANSLNVSSAPSGTAPAIRAGGLDTNISINLIPKGSGTVQVNGTPIVTGGGTTTSLTINPGPLNVTGTTNLTGPLFSIPGTAAGLEQVGGLVLFNSSADFTPTGTSAEIAYTYTLPANALSANNQYLDVVFTFTTAANGNNKRVRLLFGATAVCDTQAAGFNNSYITGRALIFRTGAATQKGLCHGFNTANGANWNTAPAGGGLLTTPAETLSGPITVALEITNATANTDGTTRFINILWYPAGQ